MNGTISYKNLASVIGNIGLQKLSGILLCSPNSINFSHLFFRKGELIHISGEKLEQSADALLHELLSWKAFNMQWQPVQVRMAEANINQDTRIAFMEVLQILALDNNLAQDGTNPVAENSSPDKSSSKNKTGDTKDGYGLVKATNPLAINVSETEPVKIEMVQPIHPQTVRMASKIEIVPVVEVKPFPSDSKPYSIETDLLLPPGLKQDQLEELLNTLTLKEQIQTLARAHFTGYAYYRPVNVSDANMSVIFGLVLLKDGNITDLICTDSQRKNGYSGAEAYKKLAELMLSIEIYKVEVRILKAYRAIIAGKKLYQNIKVTKTSFAGISVAFQKSSRDGAVLLYIDKLKLHYFFLFESGLQVGIFGPDAVSGRLKLLSTPLAFPSAESDITMTVMVIGKEKQV